MRLVYSLVAVLALDTATYAGIVGFFFIKQRDFQNGGLHLQARRIDSSAPRRRSPSIRALWVVLLVLMSTPDVACAVETITSLDTTVTTKLDGSAEVFEVIDVVTEGVQVKHGIYVDLPVFRRSGLG